MKITTLKPLNSNSLAKWQPLKPTNDPYKNNDYHHFSNTQNERLSHYIRRILIILASSQKSIKSKSIRSYEIRFDNATASTAIQYTRSRVIIYGDETIPWRAFHARLHTESWLYFRIYEYMHIYTEILTRRVSPSAQFPEEASGASGARLPTVQTVEADARKSRNITSWMPPAGEGVLFHFLEIQRGKSRNDNGNSFVMHWLPAESRSRFPVLWSVIVVSF